MAKSYKYKRSRRALTLDEFRLKMTDAAKELEKIILKEDYSESQKIQAINALSGLVGKYAKLVETTEIIERIEALEEKFQLKKVS